MEYARSLWPHAPHSWEGGTELETLSSAQMKRPAHCRTWVSWLGILTCLEQSGQLPIKQLQAILIFHRSLTFIIPFQLSPVDTRKRVRKAIPKFLKVACRPSPSQGCVSSHSVGSSAAMRPLLTHCSHPGHQHGKTHQDLQTAPLQELQIWKTTTWREDPDSPPGKRKRNGGEKKKHKKEFSLIFFVPDLFLAVFFNPKLKLLQGKNDLNVRTVSQTVLRKGNVIL